MVGADEGVKDAVVEEDPGLDIEDGGHALVDVEEAEAAAGLGVETNKKFKLGLGGRFAEGEHEIRDAIGGAGMAGAVKRMGKGVEGGVGVVEALLARGPVEEAGGEGGIGIGIGAENLGDEVGGDAAELGELGEEGRGPVAVAAEEVGDEAGERGEAARREGSGRGGNGRWILKGGGG